MTGESLAGDYGDVGAAYRNMEAQKSPTDVVLSTLHATAEQHEDGDNFRYYTLQKPEDFLKWMAGQGIIMHGTTRKLDQLEPRAANDTAKESGNRTAVYMTGSAEMAMFSALTGGVEINGWRRSGISTTREPGKLPATEVAFAVEHDEHVYPEGFVYLIDQADSDELSDNEYKSYKPVTPLAAIKITRNQFNHPIEKI